MANKNHCLVKKNKMIALAVSLLFIGILSLISYIPRFVVETKNPIIESIRKKRVPQSVELRENQELVEIDANGLQQTAILTKPNDSSRYTIILVHGIRSRKELWQSISEDFAQQGIQTLAIDLRAHGDSEGSLTSFGVHEKLDISSWVDYLENRGITEPIGIWGHSLGGAVALQALAHDKRLQFGIIVSTFSDFNTIVSDYAKEFTGVPIPFLTNYLVKKASNIAKFSPEEANPIEASKQINQPILFFHGTDDSKIKWEYNYQNFEAVPTNQKKFIKIPNADHYNILELGYDPIRFEIHDFLNSIPNNQPE